MVHRILLREYACTCTTADADAQSMTCRTGYRLVDPSPFGPLGGWIAVFRTNTIGHCGTYKGRNFCTGNAKGGHMSWIWNRLACASTAHSPLTLLLPHYMFVHPTTAPLLTQMRGQVCHPRAVSVHHFEGSTWPKQGDSHHGMSRHHSHAAAILAPVYPFGDPSRLDSSNLVWGLDCMGSQILEHRRPRFILFGVSQRALLHPNRFFISVYACFHCKRCIIYIRLQVPDHSTQPKLWHYSEYAYTAVRKYTTIVQLYTLTIMYIRPYHGALERGTYSCSR